jgi:hypothetical protein
MGVPKGWQWTCLGQHSPEAGSSENEEETIEKINTPAVLEGHSEGEVTGKSERSKSESRI